MINNAVKTSQVLPNDLWPYVCMLLNYELKKSIYKIIIKYTLF